MLKLKIESVNIVLIEVIEQKLKQEQQERKQEEQRIKDKEQKFKDEEQRLQEYNF